MHGRAQTHIHKYLSDHKVQKTTCEKIFATYVIDKGLIFLVQTKKLLQIDLMLLLNQLLLLLGDLAEGKSR